MKATAAAFVLGALLFFTGVETSGAVATGTRQNRAIGLNRGAGSVAIPAENSDRQNPATFEALAHSSVSSGTSSLLSGCTVGAGNRPSCDTPSDWTLVQAEGFDTGRLAEPTNEVIHGGRIECSFAHTGGCALTGGYFSDGNNNFWALNPKVIGSSHEVYVSWWEYLQPQARIFMEMFLALFTSPAGYSTQRDTLDYYVDTGNCVNGVGPGPPYTYGCTNGQVVTVAGSNLGGLNAAYYGGDQNLNLGAWRQYEYHFKANTPGNRDGAAQLYIDGRLAASWSNMNFNGSQDMSGMSVQVGGIYSAIKWTDKTGRGCVRHGGSRYHANCSPFSACSPCPVPLSFNRYWDDIIVLKK